MRIVKNRRHLTPPAGTPAIKGVHAMRRAGARREVTERVLLKNEKGAVCEGWALNASRGGVRVILEDKVELGKEYEVTLGEAEKGAVQKGRIVWVQEEPDGVIAGVEFVNVSPSGTLSTGPVPPAPDEDASGAARSDGSDGATKSK
jgi:PilZ domain